MKPTGRAVVVVFVAAAAVVMAAEFGARSLDAVVLPAVVVLVAGALELGLRPDVTVRRSVPGDGAVGETREVTLELTAADPFPARVTDRLDDSLDGDASVETVVGRDPVRYEVTYASRGRHRLGPTVLETSDLLGLFRRTWTVFESDEVLVYPRVHELSGAGAERLLGPRERRGVPERSEFDSLREYVRGDALRDVHWKSSAKRDSLVIQNYADGTDPDAVTVTAGATAGHDDAMAEAAASVVVALLDVGVPVTLWTPGRRVEADPDERRGLLEHLATVGAGSVPDVESDVVVSADAEGTTVRVDGETHRLEGMLGGERRAAP